MTNRPLVSIVIPCYNYGAYLAEAIDSALRQSYPTIEVLVVDDGSTDDTRAVAERYGKQVRYCYQPNGGLASARNFGLKHLRGAYVSFLDADDKLDPAYITATLAALHKHPDCAYAYTQIQHFGSDHSITNFPIFTRNELKQRNFVHATALIKTEVFSRHRYYAKSLGWEDWDFYLSLAEDHLYGVLVDKPLLLYRRHANSNSMNDRFASAKKQRQIMRQIYRRHRRLYGLRPLLRAYAVELKRSLLRQP